MLAAWCVSSTAQKQVELSACSFNVRYANPYDTLRWEDRRDEVAVAVLYFDLFGLQEVLPEQLSDLRGRLPRHSDFGQGRNADGSGEACPIFWSTDRFDFLHGEVRWLSETPQVPGSKGWDADLPRIVTIVLLNDRMTGRTVRILNSHWSHMGVNARLASSALIAGWTGSNTADVTLVMGDFNAEPHESPVVNLIRYADLKDSYVEAAYRCRKEFGTFTSFLPKHVTGATRIDYILYRGIAEADWTCADEYIKHGVYISDHLPLHTIFKIPMGE